MQASPTNEADLEGSGAGAAATSRHQRVQRWPWTVSANRPKFQPAHVALLLIDFAERAIADGSVVHPETLGTAPELIEWMRDMLKRATYRMCRQMSGQHDMRPLSLYSLWNSLSTGMPNACSMMRSMNPRVPLPQPPPHAVSQIRAWLDSNAEANFVHNENLPPMNRALLRIAEAQLCRAMIAIPYRGDSLEE